MLGQQIKVNGSILPAWKVLDTATHMVRPESSTIIDYFTSVLESNILIPLNEKSNVYHNINDKIIIKIPFSKEGLIELDNYHKAKLEDKKMKIIIEVDGGLEDISSYWEAINIDEELIRSVKFSEVEK